MKVQIFTTGVNSQINLADGSIETNWTDENLEDFMARILSPLKDVATTVYDMKKLRSKASSALVNQHAKSQGLETKMLEEILDARGVSYKGENLEAMPVVFEIEAPKAKAPKVKAEPKAKAKAEPKVKTLPTQEELDHVKKIAEKAKENVKKSIDFYPFGRSEKLEEKALITAVWIDKRVPLAFYSIRLEDGIMKNKVVHSPDITNIY